MPWFFEFDFWSPPLWQHHWRRLHHIAAPKVPLPHIEEQCQTMLWTLFVRDFLTKMVLWVTRTIFIDDEGAVDNHKLEQYTAGQEAANERKMNALVLLLINIFDQPGAERIWCGRPQAPPWVILWSAEGKKGQCDPITRIESHLRSPLLIEKLHVGSETANRSRRTQSLPAIPSKERATCSSSVSCGFSSNCSWRQIFFFDVRYDTDLMSEGTTEPHDNYRICCTQELSTPNFFSTYTCHYRKHKL